MQFFKSSNTCYSFISITLVILYLFIENSSLRAQKAVFIDNSKEVTQIQNGLYLLADSTNELTLQQIISSKKFKPISDDVPNLGLTNSSIWLKFDLHNKLENDLVTMDIRFPTLDFIELHLLYPNGKIISSQIGEYNIFSDRKYLHPSNLFDIAIPYDSTVTCYLNIKSDDPIVLPIYVGITEKLLEYHINKDLLFGMYMGFMLLMFFYNIFIYYSVRDVVYLYYVIYILCVGLAQIGLHGYPFKYLWPNLPIFARYSSFILPCLAGLTSFLFVKKFMDLKNNARKLNFILNIIVICYIPAIFLAFVGAFQPSYGLMQLLTGLGSFISLFSGIYLLRKGFSSAKFFVIGWAALLTGVIVYILQETGSIPRVTLTIYAMPIGSALEMALLSFALADRINVFRKEKEEAQEEAVIALKENERIIRDQNVILEKQVDERTLELNNTLTDLKEAQSQLVDAEKMSSLGQLTAGIAHEINNPINFVSSNVHPLRQDLDDINTILQKYEELDPKTDITVKLEEINQLKEELDYDYLKTEIYSIIDGIEDGAKRTTEIVSGLRNFSRLDESELKSVDINEGIESTLVLIKNKLDGITIEKNLGKIPECECNAGKINQLTMNLLDNAIFAIKKKENGNQNGLINVTTENNDLSIIITIKDNGIGIPSDVRDKLFEPFFTTKDVGEGTGLGLSIVRSIVDSHNGKIKVNSEVNVGTEIIVELPINNISN